MVIGDHQPIHKKFGLLNLLVLLKIQFIRNQKLKTELYEQNV